jgi:hypothetical protein
MITLKKDMVIEDLPMFLYIDTALYPFVKDIKGGNANRC